MSMLFSLSREHAIVRRAVIIRGMQSMPNNPSRRKRKASAQNSEVYRARQRALGIPVGRQIDYEVAVALVGLLVRRKEPTRLDVQLDRLCQMVVEQLKLDEANEPARNRHTERRFHNAKRIGYLSIRAPRQVSNL